MTRSARQRWQLSHQLAGLAVLVGSCAHSGERLSAPALPSKDERRASGDLLAGPVLSTGVLGYAVAFDRSGDRLATIELDTEFALVVRSPPHTASRPTRVREPTRVPLATADYDIVDLDFAPAGDRVWTASVDGVIREVRLPSASVSKRWILGRPATAVASVGERWVATGDADGVVCLRRARDGALLQCVADHGDRVADLAAAQTTAGDWTIASAGWDGRVTVWSIPSLAVVARRQWDGSANALAFDAQGRRLAIALSALPPRRTPHGERRQPISTPTAVDPRNRAEVWTPGSGKPNVVCQAHAAAVTAVAWTTDAQRLASGSMDHTVRLCDAQNGATIAQSAPLSGAITGLAASPDGRFLAVSSWVSSLDQPSTRLLRLSSNRR